MGGQQPTTRAPSYSPQSASQPAQQAAPRPAMQPQDARPAMQPQDGRIDPRSMSPFGVPWSIGPREVGDTSTEDQGPSFEPYQGGREYDAGNITGLANVGQNLKAFGADVGSSMLGIPGGRKIANAFGAGLNYATPFQTDGGQAMYSQGPDGTGGQVWSDNPSRVGVEVAGYNGRSNPREGAPQGGQGGSGYGQPGQQAMGGYAPQGAAGGYSYGGYDLNQPWTQITTLDPAEQANLDQQRSLTNRALGIGQSQLANIGNTLSTPLDYSGAPKVEGLNFGNLPSVRGTDYGSLGAIPQLNLSGAPGMPDAAQFQGPNSQTTDAIYKAYTSRLAPQWDRERESVESRLASQGVNVQTNPEAYSRALEDFNKSRTDAYQMALAQAVGSGVQENSNAFNRSLAARQQGVGEAGQLFGANLQGRQQLGSEMAQQQASDLQRRQQMASEQGQLYNASLGTRQQAIQEQMALRNQPINELAALLGTSGGVNTPQFGGVPQVNVAAPDVMGAQGMAYNAQQNTYNQQQQSRNAGLGAAGTLAGIGLQTAFPAAKVART